MLHVDGKNVSMILLFFAMLLNANDSSIKSIVSLKGLYTFILCKLTTTGELVIYDIKYKSKS